MPYVPVGTPSNVPPYTPSAAVTESEKRRKQPPNYPAQIPLEDSMFEDRRPRRDSPPPKTSNEWQYNC
jgi:hypothetical protein